MSSNVTEVPYDDDGAEELIYVFWGIIMPIIAAFGFLGNCLTMLVLFRKEMASSTIYYLRALVVTDTIFLVMTVGTLTPFGLVHVSETFMYYRNVIYPKVFIFFNYLIMSTQACNVWITVCVTLERFIYICYPFMAPGLISRKSTLIIILVVSIFSAVYNLPRIFAYEWDPCTKNTCGEPDLNDNFGNTPVYKQLYMVWLYIIVMFIIPLASLFILSFLIIRELMRMRERRSGMNIDDDNEANMTVALVLIVVVFILCQTLGLFTQFEDFVDFNVFLKILAVSNTLYVFNASVTFYIYAAVGQKFRNTLVNRVFFRCVHPSRQRLSSHTNNMYHLTTMTEA